MEDPNLALLNAYMDALEGMSFSGVDVPVYSRYVPLTNTAKKYVLLQNQVKTENKTKQGYWWECTIEVNIVTRYPNGKGDMTFNMVIGEEIAERIEVVWITLEEFLIREAKQLTSRESVSSSDSEDIFEYIVPFYYKINSMGQLTYPVWYGAPGRPVDEQGEYVFVDTPYEN